MNYGYAVCAIGLLVLAVVYMLDMWSARELRHSVFDNLDSATEGGQFRKPYGYLYGLTASEIAADMVLYCEDVSGYDADELLPCVETWLRRNAEKVYPS